MPCRGRRVVRLVAAAVSLAVLGACSGTDGAPSAAASAGTDDGRGDACEQAVSNISYTEGALVALGQERYQEFDDHVRSALVDVQGTMVMEDRPWPDDEIAEQAQRVADLAGAAAERDAEDPVTSLVEYRSAAARLVLLCYRAG